MKIAVVTPYWQEPCEIIQRCLDTVRGQSVPATHYLVSDGNPQVLPTGCDAVHLVLPENVGNCGSTPRGLGAQLAFNDGFDVVAFLDVDNWWEPGHLESAIALLERERLDVVFARRTIVFPDGEILQVDDPQESGHVDTSCHVMSRRAAFMAAVWAMHPKAFGAGEERLALAVIRQLQLKTARLDARTVSYQSNWAHHYALAGKTPVQPLRQPERRVSSHFEPTDYYRHTGVRLALPAAPEAALPAEPADWRVAVVTPYRGESAAAMSRCMASVAAQGGSPAHYVISDEALPCPVLTPAPTGQLVLPGQRDDHGNTARGLGAMLSFQLGADAVAFLDADDCFVPGELDAMKADLQAGRGALVMGSAPGHLMLPRRAAYLGALWAQLPAVADPADNTAMFLQLVAARHEARTVRPVPGASLTEPGLFQSTGVRTRLAGAAIAPGLALKIAVVSPYFRETPEVLARCLSTVRQQTVPVQHYLVADGNPQAIVAERADVHLVLPGNAGNYGATPRGLGAQLAFNDGCDVVAFLDADNWFEPDHLARAVELMEREGLDVVFARRTIVFPDGEVLSMPDPQDAGHVDSNCYVLSKRAAFLAGAWAMYPRQFGSGEDRVILAAIRQMQLRTGWVDVPTVWYESNWQAHYDLAGKIPARPPRTPTKRVTTHFHPERYFRQTGMRLPFAASPQAEPIVDPASTQWRIAVVTPYQGGPSRDLARCLASVAAQGPRVVHFLVSDEGAVPPCSNANVQRFVLPGSRGDFGNTARGLGAMFAFQAGFDAVAFLDANAWFVPGHLENIIGIVSANAGELAVCIPPGTRARSGNRFQGNALRQLTSSILLTRRAAYLGAAWAQLPLLPTAERNALFYLQAAEARDVRLLLIGTGGVHMGGCVAAASSSAAPPALSDKLLFEKTGLRARA